MKAAIRFHVSRLGSAAVLVLLAGTAAQAAQPRGDWAYRVGQRQPAARQAPSRAMLVSQAQADAQADAQSVPEPIAETPDDSSAAGEAPSAWDDGGGSCNKCGEDCGGTCCGGGLWYGSVDYLLFRPRMSQAVAEVRRVQTIDQTSTPPVSTLTDKVIEYPFDYQSGFRVAAGYRFLDCGGDFQVGYWRMTNDANFTDGPANVSDDDPFIAGNLENNPGNGEFLRSSTGVTANIFDVDFGKCISMGGPCGSCEPCSPCCPLWDLRFFAGARIADISRFNNNVVFDDDGNGLSFGNINARFVGAGPRVGIQGRRYLGACGLWSLYAKASQAILIGDYRMGRTLTIPGEDETPTQITNQFNRFSRTIPVSDIEVGGTWQMAPYTFISVGYFFQCWWDLGQGENIQGTNFGALDSANILGFDGLFVRGEMLF